jgi:hypothetical protein
VLINPAGWHLYELTWRVMRESELIARIPEMMPPRFPEHWPFFALLLMAAAALVFGLFRRGIVRPGEGLALLFFGWQATSHLRHVPLFVIVAALPVGRLMQLYSDWWAQRLTLRGAELITLFKMLLLTLFVLVGVGTGLIVWKHRLIWEPHAPRNTRWFEGFGYEPTQYQDAACDALISAGAPPRLWTNLNIGGFMIWRLSPETLKVFTDSRFDVHGGGPQRVEMSLNGVGPDGGVPDPDWEQVLDDLGVNVAVLEKATPLVRAMWASPNWVAVHEWTAPGRRWRDGTMTFIRDVPENETAISVVRRYAEVRNQSPQPPPSPM